MGTVSLFRVLKLEKHMTGLTVQRLKELLRYDPETGVFYRLKGTGKGAHVGAVAGSKTKFGYIVISADRHPYMAHRLAWLYTTGDWPAGLLDHKDGDRSNNAFSNLREATKSQNAANAKRHSDNSSGIKGVSLHKASGRWRATIGFNGRQFGLGYFVTKEEAQAAYSKKAKELFNEFKRDA